MILRLEWIDDEYEPKCTKEDLVYCCYVLTVMQTFSPLLSTQFARGLGASAVLMRIIGAYGGAL